MKTSTSRPCMPSLITFAVILLAGVAGLEALPCSQEHLIQCATSLRVFSDNQELGFAAKKEDLDVVCPDLNAGLRCIDEFTRRCMAPHQRSHFNKLYAGSSMVIQEICQEGPYQEEFLKHASCMYAVKQDSEECASDYQQKIQDMSNHLNNGSSDGDNERHVRRLCCSFQEYLSCSHAIVRDTCGEDTATFTKGFMDRMASSLIQVHCDKYPPGSQICSDDTSAAPRSQSSSLIGLLLPLLVLIPLYRT